MIILVFILIFILFCCEVLYARDKSLPAENNSLLLDFYKNHISVVDGNRCAMYPSCSTYASQAFKKHGYLLGWIVSCDRLMRCGGDEANISQKTIVNSYPLIYDPVESNDFWWFEKNRR